MHPIRAWRLAQPPEQATLEAAGKRLGVGRSVIWKWENGVRKIAPERVPAVSAITGIPAELLRPDVYRSVSFAHAEQLIRWAS